MKNDLKNSFSRKISEFRNMHIRNLSTCIFFSLCFLFLPCMNHGFAQSLEKGDSPIKHAISMDDMKIASKEEIPENYVGIYSVEDLNSIRNNLSSKYILMNDIEFQASDFLPSGIFYNNGNGRLSIGTEENPFEGIFDGNGYCIKNLDIQRTLSNETSYNGLFGYSLGEIKRVCLENCKISIKNSSSLLYVGGVVAYNKGSISKCISNCEIDIETSVDKKNYKGVYAYIGGLIGHSEGPISQSTNGSNIQIKQSTIDYADPSSLEIGGIVARCGTSEIMNCTVASQII